MREKDRNERPKKGADVQPCLSDVYKNGTRAKRRQADVPLCGRSMVEMLGVLAIIGVLSVGAIAGYSKAMFKYKLNKQVESFNMLLNNAIQIKPQLDYAFNGTDSFNADLFDKLNLIPDGMTYENNYIYDVFHNQITLSYYNAQNGNIDYAMGINMNRANNKISQDSAEICRSIITVAKENAANLHSIRMRSGENDDTYSENILFGNEYCRNNASCLYNASLQQIDDVCASCESETYCRIIIFLMIRQIQP